MGYRCKCFCHVDIDYIPGEPEKIKYLLYNPDCNNIIATNYALLNEDPYVIDWYNRRGYNILARL